MEAMQTIIDLMKDPDPRVRGWAADRVLERAWGKPKEEEDSRDHPFEHMTPKQRKRRLAELLAFAASCDTIVNKNTQMLLWITFA